MATDENCRSGHPVKQHLHDLSFLIFKLSETLLAAVTTAPTGKTLSTFRGKESPCKIFNGLGCVGQLRKMQVLRKDLEDVTILRRVSTAWPRAIGDQDRVGRLDQRGSLSASNSTPVVTLDPSVTALRARHCLHGTHIMTLPTLPHQTFQTPCQITESKPSLHLRTKCTRLILNPTAPIIPSRPYDHMLHVWRHCPFELLLVIDC